MMALLIWLLVLPFKLFIYGVMFVAILAIVPIWIITLLIGYVLIS